MFDTILLRANFLAEIGIYLMIYSPIAFLIGLVLTIVLPKQDKKIGINTMIVSAITFIIGIGSCFVAVSQ